MPSSPNVAVYGLSTEGYNFASSIVSAGHKVSIIDESSKMGILLNKDITRTYSNASDLIEDQPLLEVESIDNVISSASYLFFFPKIRKIGHEVKIDISSKFIDAIKPINKNTSVVYSLPMGIAGNEENIDILEHTTGMTVGDNLYYYYMPLNSGPLLSTTTILGNFNSKRDTFLEGMLNKFTSQEINFVDVVSAELAYVSRILRHYSGIASVLEVCKIATGYGVDNRIVDNFHTDLYLDDITNGLHDLRIIQSSLHGSNPLVYLVNGTIKSIEGYTKNLIDKVRYILKKRDLKASKTKISISWTLDVNEMRGDKIDVYTLLESKLRDYIGDVERRGNNTLDNYPSDKTTIYIACSKTDFQLLSKNNSAETIIVKANPFCEVV